MVAAKTRKLPVSISYEGFEAKSDEFLIPPLQGTPTGFQGLRSGAIFPYGAVSYLGRDVTVNDVFAKLVDSGQRIENVAGVLKMLEAYIEMLQEYRIGNILGIEPCDDAPCGFRLKKIANSPPTKSTNLP